MRLVQERKIVNLNETDLRGLNLSQYKIKSHLNLKHPTQANLSDEIFMVMGNKVFSKATDHKRQIIDLFLAAINILESDESNGVSFFTEIPSGALEIGYPETGMVKLNDMVSSVLQLIGIQKSNIIHFFDLMRTREELMGRILPIQNKNQIKNKAMGG